MGEHASQHQEIIKLLNNNKALPMFDRKPPLPSASFAIRFMTPKEEANLDRELVSLSPYSQEKTMPLVEGPAKMWSIVPLTYNEGKHSMGLSTLMLITWQNRQQQMQPMS